MTHYNVFKGDIQNSNRSFSNIDKFSNIELSMDQNYDIVLIFIFLSFLLFDLDCNEVEKKQKIVDRIFTLHLNNYFGVSIWQNEFS